MLHVFMSSRSGGAEGPAWLVMKGCENGVLTGNADAWNNDDSKVMWESFFIVRMQKFVDTFPFSRMQLDASELLMSR